MEATMVIKRLNLVMRSHPDLKRDTARPKDLKTSRANGELVIDVFGRLYCPVVVATGLVRNKVSGELSLGS